MLTHPTLDKLLALKLTGMAKALSEQMDVPESQAPAIPAEPPSLVITG